jgi:hypothetical protein
MLGVACSEDAVSASGQWLADAVPDPSAFDAAFDARRCKKGLVYRCPWTGSSNALPVGAKNTITAATYRRTVSCNAR